MSSSNSDNHSGHTLSEAQKSHFLEHGYIKVPSCFTRDQASSFTSDLWTRLGMSPTDKSTWTTERTNMPWHKHVSVKEFSPRAWSAICQLLAPESGSEEEGDVRITNGGNGVYRSWSDGFIVNVGRDGFDGREIEDMEEGERLRGLGGWHVDGDFFVHYLDSPEQAILVIPLWSDIKPHGGGTAIACDSIKHIAKYLHQHPSGLTPWFKPTTDPTEIRTFFQDLAADTSRIRTKSIIEATGEIGDVYLIHPLMLHSASENLLRIPRVITNPPVMLKEPFNFDREDGKYSLVEKKTLRELGVKEGEGLKGWKIEGERMPWVSARIKRQEAERQKEKERLGSDSA
ncbi:hypothetical protein BJ875DRAFT_373524 [Amylocarpus encephaloides]|uniref:Uncharacterized protein n=1 Tax=Amylocarpus encephaloides TaxID=45428 RepID=A0A9P7YLP4_9HELO|nr:hypothetical protein BJ875DRAFT_373524 [Amylocarpus encephaloides]